MNLESKARINSLISAANATTGKADTDLTSAVGALIAGFGQGGSGGGAFEVTEGTITPTSETQSIRIPWDKSTLPLFYVVIRPDLDTYVTPDNPATGPVLGGVVNFSFGYIRASSSATWKYASLKLTATTGYTGYAGGHADIQDELLNSDGLLAHSNSSAYKWQPDTTYKYFIVDKVVA